MGLHILRVGGSVLTDRESDVPRINKKNMQLLADEIRKALIEKDMDLVIAHGMGSYGHPIAEAHNLQAKQMHTRKIIGSTLLAHSLTSLNHQFVKALIEKDIPAISFPPHHSILEDGKIIRKDLEALQRYIEMGFVPVLQAYPAYDAKKGISILSSDHIAPYVACAYNADMIVNCMSIDGVFDKNPEHPDANIIPVLMKEHLENLQFDNTSYVDVTGGMNRTVSEAVCAARKGVPTRIVNATKPNIVSQTLLGSAEHGTLISPQFHNEVTKIPPACPQPSESASHCG